MQMRFGLLVLLTIALAVPAVMSVTAPVSGQAGFLAQPDAVDADNVRITVRINEDGSANWTLAFRTVLDTENRTEAFESLQRDIQANPSGYTAPFAERIRNTVATAENTTERKMAAEGFSIDTTQQSIARDYGIVTYSFTWNGFADTAGDTLAAGDAIDGFYLADGTRLRIQWPSGYERQSVSPAPDEERDNAVIWAGGQTDFVSGEPRVTVGSSGPGLGLIGGVAVVVVLAILAGWFLVRRQGDDDRTAATPTASADSAGDPETTADADTADSTAVTDAETSNPTDAELLSNEEQVLRLLDENGGRMKQKHVVEELGWTDAKTSKVVSGLRDDDEIESFRIGRENVLTFPDEGLTDE